MPKYTDEQRREAGERCVEICQRARDEGRHGEFFDYCYECGKPQYAFFHVTLGGKYICQWCAYAKHGVEDSAMMTDVLEADGGEFREDDAGVWWCEIRRGRVFQVWRLNAEKSVWERTESKTIEG